MHLDEYSEYEWRHMTRINVCYSICTHEYHWTISTKACSLKCNSCHVIGQPMQGNSWYKFLFYCTENLQKRTEIEFTSFCRLAHRVVRTSHVQIVSRVDPIERRTGILLARYSASKINLLKFLERNLENLVNKKGRKGAGKVLN